MKLLFVIISMMLVLASAGYGQCQQLIAFPGAQGAGKYSTGGRGGDVYIVTNLNDSGPGSLREGIEKRGPRIIVFEVNGYVHLKSPLKINNNDITIAGQSAPGSGICLKGYGIIINADNVVIRYLKIRPGDIAGIEQDALTGKNNRNIIIDHCSFSWATDEVCSLYDNENLTLQWCIVSESLNKSCHSKGAHGYGGIWGGINATFHHNLVAHHISRNPRLQGSRYNTTPENEYVEIVNNVIYNWQKKCIYAGEGGRYYLCNNYFKPGPATSKSVSNRLLELYPPYCYFKFANNVLYANESVTLDNLKGIIIDKDSLKAHFKEDLRPVSDIKLQSTVIAYEEVLKYAGASYNRDDIDARIVDDVRNGTARSNNTGIIDSQSEVGGWGPVIESLSPDDKDRDGMPDKWELDNKLNPDDKADASCYSLDRNYTNIEVYLNHLLNNYYSKN